MWQLQRHGVPSWPLSEAEKAMKILVLGTPFSGAARLCNLLRLAGYHVGNGTVDRDGIVNTLLVTRDASPKHYLGYEHIFHMVGNPIVVLTRLCTMSPTRAGRFTWAETVYVNTNRYIASIAEARIRIECMDKDWPSILFKPKQFTRYRRMSRPLRAVKLSDDVRRMAKEYGYEL